MAIGIGFLIHKDAGYILLSYDKWTIETSIWVGLFILIILFLAIQALFHCVRRTAHFGRSFKNWGASRNKNKGHKKAHAGLCELAEGNWDKAESLLIKSVKAGASPFIAYLAAARAAQAQKAYNRRDEYLKKAHEAKESSDMAVGLTQAQLQIDAEQWEQAIATLQHLNQENPSHRYVICLLHKVYVHISDWSALHALLPCMKRAKAMDKAELHDLEAQVYHKMLLQENVSHDSIQKLWQDMPRALQTSAPLVIAYVGRIKQDQMRALKLIKAALDKTWNSQLVCQYGERAQRCADCTESLNTAEKWLTNHPKDPELLLCLAKLSIALKMWGKAKYYLEACVPLMGRADVYQALGQVMQALGEQKEALNYYKKGLEVC